MPDKSGEVKNNNSQSLQSEQQEGKQLTISSPYLQYYSARLNLILNNSSKFMKNLSTLKNNGFQYNKQFSFEFQKTIVNSWKDSVKFQIQYGNFRTFLSVSLTSFDFKTFQREQISRGNFGKILSFTYKQNPLVAKSFYFDSTTTQLDYILRQIFWTKFASILGIGPRFINLYGFDLIFLKNSCEFLMQECLGHQFLNKYYQANEQTIEDRMKSIIQTLHSFHAINGDIKLDHIAWSPLQKEIILLDFGMSQFIKEQIGQMTRTQYFGTFPYCCREMKKAYLLKSLIYVDLFFNDLYAVQACFKKFKQSQCSYSFVKIQTVRPEEQWQLIAGIFNFKFHLFSNNSSGAIAVYKQFQELAKCFRLIINIQQKEDPTSKFTASLWDDLRDQMKHQQLKLTKNDSSSEIICREILQNNKGHIICNLKISETIIYNMYKNETLDSFLDSEVGQESLFEFIFERIKISDIEANIKLKIIKYIFLTKKKSQLSNNEIQPNVTSRFMVRSVLLIFQHYFFKAGNLDKLESIENIFRFTCQFKYLKKVQQNICEIFMKNSDLWLDNYRKGIVTMFNQNEIDTLLNYNKNPRSRWEWLTTIPQIQKQFLPKNNEQFIKSCTKIIRQIDRKSSLNYINLKYDEKMLFEVLKDYEQQLVRKEGSKKNNIEIIQIEGKQLLILGGNIQCLKEGVLSLQTCLALGILKLNQQTSFLCFKQALVALSYILRKTVWELALHHKNNNLVATEEFLEQFFEDIFVSQMAQGVNIFVIFSQILFKGAQNSQKIKKLLLNFLKNIRMKIILEQLREDAYSLKQVILNFIEISKKFLSSGFDEKQIISNLDNLYNEISIFFSDNADKWWSVPESEVSILLEIIKVYYPALKNSSQLKAVTKMIQLAERIMNKKQSITLLCFVIMSICQLISTQSFKNRIDLIWEMLSKIQDKALMVCIIERNTKLFRAVIYKICSDCHFEECLNLLEQYGRQLDSTLLFVAFFNNSYVNFFSDFVELLPDDIAYEMFIKKLDTFNLRRIKNSPRLSLIFLILLDNKKILFQDTNKVRYIRLVSFGLSKIRIRYNNFIEINGRLLCFHRLFIPSKNSRKEIIHLRNQGRASHDQYIIRKLVVYKQKRCKIRKKTEQLQNIVKSKLLKKLRSINLNCQKQSD